MIWWVLLSVLLHRAGACSALPPPLGYRIEQVNATLDPTKVHVLLQNYPEDPWTPTSALQAEVDLTAQTIEQATVPSLPTQSTLGPALDQSVLKLDVRADTRMIVVTLRGRLAARLEASDTAVQNPSAVFAFYSEAAAQIFVLDPVGRVYVVPESRLGATSHFDWPYYLDSGRPIEVYDSLQLVAFPQPCCVCISRAFYRFTDEAFLSVDALNTATASAPPCADSRVDAVHTGSYLSLATSDLASGATSTIAFHNYQIEALLPSPSPAPPLAGPPPGQGAATSC